MTGSPSIEDRRPFLTARWEELALLSYAVALEVLEPLAPPGCELDTVDGQAFVSLVGLQFRDTRVLGVRWPWHVNFPEINLRFYARFGGQRGVVFIRELVPRRLVAWIARAFYNEPYAGVAMESQTQDVGSQHTIRYSVALKGKIHAFSVTGAVPAQPVSAQGLEHFLKEHEWGFGTSRRGELVRYRVIHPVWDIYPVESFTLDWDWSAIYGPRWAFLQTAEPSSVIFARGSEVRVLPKGRNLIAAGAQVEHAVG